MGTSSQGVGEGAAGYLRPVMSTEPTILFAHVPWRRDLGGLTRRRIMAIPFGVFGLAGLARAAGWCSSIVHVGLEQIAEPGYRLHRDLPVASPLIVALSLHWHHQLPAVIEAARRVKRARPDAVLLVGGITASVLADELLGHCPWIDLVVRGEAEEPLRRLLERAGRGDASVPNLSWRDGERVVHNERSWSATTADLDALELDVGLLRNADRYTGAIEHPPPPGVRDPLWGSPRTFHLVVGRGCHRDCGYCGGSRASYAGFLGRRGVTLRSAELVAADARALVAAGFPTVYFPFVPPGTTRWYVELFERVAAAGALPGTVLEHYDGLPSAELLEACAGAFEERTIVLSPGSAVPALRSRHGLLNPGNGCWEAAIERCEGSGARALVYFTLMPDDSVDTLHLTADWMSELRARYDVGLQFVRIEVEPGSAWVADPQRFGVELRRRGFADFLQHHMRGELDDPGYRVRHAEAKRRVIEERIQPLVQGALAADRRRGP